MGRRFLVPSGSIVGISFAALLAGCSGTTYGTGVSSEEQLLNDVTGLITIGAQKPKKKIDYTSRPTLVKAPTVAELPTPAETVQSESGYFPEDPEAKRARLVAEADSLNENGDTILSPELQALRDDSRRRANLEKRRTDYTLEHGGSWHTQQRNAAETRKLVLARKTAQRAQHGAQPRKYLTQPPAEYRQPADTATVGVVGEKETANAGLPPKQKKGNIFSDWFGG